MPASTSPLPADASPGLPVALMRQRPSGKATMVPQPLSATWALKRCASCNAALTRSPARRPSTMPSRRAASAGCGVSRVGADGGPLGPQAPDGRRAGSSASASITSGKSALATRRRMARAVPETPRPGPTTTVVACASASSGERSISSGCSGSTASACSRPAKDPTGTELAARRVPPAVRRTGHARGAADHGQRAEAALVAAARARLEAGTEIIDGEQGTRETRRDAVRGRRR
jgi:hypothetical protein